MRIGELVAYLRADSTDLDDGLDQSERRMRRMGGVASAAMGAAGALGGAALTSAMTDAVSFEAANAKLSAQLALTADEAAAAGDLASKLYAEGWGNSIDDLNAAVRGVAQNMGVEIDSVDMEPLTRQAAVLADVFGMDVAESTRAAGALMRNLGVDGQTAMDMIAKVTQNHGDRAADLLDTIEEYSPQFEKMGLSGQQAMGMLDQALAGNARNSDIAADAIKEFSIRSVDGSDAAAKSFEALGLNAAEMTATFAKGGPEAQAALDTVFDRLRATEGQANAAEIAFGLFGTQSEDLGRALYTIDPSEAVAGLGEFAGTLDRAGDAMSDTAQNRVVEMSRGLTNLGRSAVEMDGPVGMVAATVAAFGPAGIAMAGSLSMVGMALGPLLVRLPALAVAAVTTSANVVAALLRMAVAAGAAGARMLVSLVLWVAGVVAQGAVAVASLAVTAAGYVASWALMAVQAMARAAMMAAAWVVAMGPVGWVTAAIIALVALVIANWDSVKSFTIDAWNAVVGFLVGAGQNIVNTVTGAVENARNGVTNGFNAVVGFVGSIPGRILGVLSGLGGLLLNSGRALVDGFLAGIRGAWNSVVGFVQDGMQTLRNLWPFSPAKAGPFSGSGYVTHSGKALTSDFAKSIRGGIPGVLDSARDMAAAAQGAMNPTLDAPAMRVPATTAQDDAAFAAAARLRAGAGADTRPISITVNNPIAERASSSIARTARTYSDLGAF